MSEYRTGRFHDGEGWRVSLLREGHKRLHITCIYDTGVTHSVVPREEVRHIRPVLFKGDTYPIKRMIRKFREVARERGITEAAKEELKRAGGES